MAFCLNSLCRLPPIYGDKFWVLGLCPEFQPRATSAAIFGEFLLESFREVKIFRQLFKRLSCLIKSRRQSKSPTISTRSALEENQPPDILHRSDWACHGIVVNQENSLTLPHTPYNCINKHIVHLFIVMAPSLKEYDLRRSGLFWKRNGRLRMEHGLKARGFVFSPPPIGTITMRKKEDLHTVYNAALSVFAEYGFRKSTLEDIAARLGMTKSNLYLYAKNKKALYHDTVAWALTRWQNHVRSAVAKARDPKSQFTVMCFKAVEYLSEDNDFRRVLIHDPEIFPMFPVEDPFHDINRRSVEMIKDILVRGIREKQFRHADPDRLSEVIFSIYKMVIIRTYIRTKDDEMKEVFANIFELMTRGLFVE